MRVSREQAGKNRDHVIDVAGRLFRERGFNGIGLSDLMKAAGLTHGGFYGQFKSKEDLAVQATGRALLNSRESLLQSIAGVAERKLSALARAYLSVRHRDAPDKGCPIVALGADAARFSPELRATLSAGVKRHLDLLTELGEAPDAEERRQQAMVALSTMVGALLLARTVDDDALSKTILNSAADAVDALSAPTDPVPAPGL